MLSVVVVMWCVIRPVHALASVFLRVLEYYDGTLSLTRNDVGSLEEAFRSRIQTGCAEGKLKPSAGAGISNFSRRSTGLFLQINQQPACFLIADDRLPLNPCLYNLQYCDRIGYGK